MGKQLQCNICHQQRAKHIEGGTQKLGTARELTQRIDGGTYRHSLQCDILQRDFGDAGAQQRQHGSGHQCHASAEEDEHQHRHYRQRHQVYAYTRNDSIKRCTQHEKQYYKAEHKEHRTHRTAYLGLVLYQIQYQSGKHKGHIQHLAAGVHDIAAGVLTAVFGRRAFVGLERCIVLGGDNGAVVYDSLAVLYGVARHGDGSDVLAEQTLRIITVVDDVWHKHGAHIGTRQQSTHPGLIGH